MQAPFSSFIGQRVGLRVQSRDAPGNAAITRAGGESRIGKVPLPVPKGVTYTLSAFSDKQMVGQHLAVKGPKGELERTFPPEVAITEDKAKGTLVFKAADESRRAHQMHGLSRTLASNMVTGVVKEFETKLTLVGVGYKAALEGSKTLVLNIGMTHQIKLPFPAGVTAKVDQNVNLSIMGRDKEVVGSFAAGIRAMRPPEPYKGKGVKYVDEVIIRKEGKTGKGK